MPTAGEYAESALANALETYHARNLLYQDSFVRSGKVLAALFPDGVEVAGPEDWSRVTVLVHIVDKLARYTADFDLKHQDSVHDLGVYAFILEGVDCAARQRKVTDVP